MTASLKILRIYLGNYIQYSKILIGIKESRSLWPSPPSCQKCPISFSLSTPAAHRTVGSVGTDVTTSLYHSASYAAAHNSRPLHSTEPSIKTNCLFLSDHKKKSGFIVCFGYVAWVKTRYNARNSTQPSPELKPYGCSLQFWLTKQNNSQLVLRPRHSPRNPSLYTLFIHQTATRAWRWRYSLKGFEGWHEKGSPRTA